METGQDKLRDVNPQRLESTTKAPTATPLAGMSQFSLSASEKFSNNMLWILLFVFFPNILETLLWLQDSPWSYMDRITIRCFDA